MKDKSPLYPSLLIVVESPYLSAVQAFADRHQLTADITVTDQLVGQLDMSNLPDLIISFLAPHGSPEILLNIRSLFPLVPHINLPAIKGIDKHFFDLMHKLIQAKLTRLPHRTLGNLESNDVNNQVRKALHGLLHPSPAFFDGSSLKTNELQVRFMGRFGMKFGSKVSGETGLAQRNKSLLAYLLHNGHKLKHKHQIAETFWPYGSGSAINSLHVGLHAIRKYLKKELGVGNLIEHVNGCYRINRQYTIHSDIANFDKIFRNLEPNAPLGLIAGYQAYRGPLLEELLDEPWTGPLRTQYHHRFQSLLEQLINLADANDLPIVSWELKAKQDLMASRSAA